MGTRHLIAVKHGGEYKISQYGQWDGYPEGQGVQVLTFLRATNLNVFREAVSECTYATDEELDRSYTDMGIFHDKYGCILCDEADKHAKRFPEFSRDTGAKILSLVCLDGKRKLKNSLDFVADSLFCEWAYVIDLDKNTFEVYKGFNQTPLTESEPFYFLQEQGKSYVERRGGDQYFPVKFVALWALDCLPSNNDFIAVFKQEEEQ